MGRQGWIVSTLARIWDWILVRLLRGRARLRRQEQVDASRGIGLRPSDRTATPGPDLGKHDTDSTERSFGPAGGAVDSSPESGSSASRDRSAADDVTEPLPTDDVFLMIELEEREDEVVFTPDPATGSDDGELSFVPAPDMTEDSETLDMEFVSADESDSAATFPDRTNGWVRGDGTKVCPDGFPIKGNGKSHIYHVPGAASYAATIPELCFATEEVAVAQGFRPPKRSRASPDSKD